MLQKRESFTLNQIAELDAFCILILIKDAKGGFGIIYLRTYY